MRPPLLLAALIVGAGTGYFAQTARQQAVEEDVWGWEGEIQRFEAADREAPPRPGGIVFVGSSSIRLWRDLHAEFPGQNVIQRGVGGSTLLEVLHFAPRIVLPYKPKLIFLYAGENDLVAGRKPQDVFQDYKFFVALVRRSLPSTRIVYISIKPSPKRWPFAPEVRATNALIRDYIAKDPKLSYVDVFTPMLGANGLPREELYVEDGVHLNHEGYALWKELLTPYVPVATRISEASAN